MAEPRLLAFLVCERALLEQDGTASLIRVIDTITLAVAGPGAATDPLPPIPTVINCVIFTRWGPGEGEHVEELRMVGPNLTERAESNPITFSTAGEFRFQQNRRDLALGVSQPGMYTFRLYLDGELAGEHPLRILFERVTPEQGFGTPTPLS